MISELSVLLAFLKYKKAITTPMTEKHNIQRTASLDFTFDDF